MADDTMTDDNAAAVDIDAQQADAEAKAFTVEDIAGEMGWSPQDKWRGDPGKWKPADQFLRTTAEINRGLHRDVKALRDQTDRLARTSATIAADRVAQVRAELQAKFADAVEAGDVKAASKASDDLARIKAEPDAPDSTVADFMDRNKGWYDKDDEATALAVSVSQRLASQGKTQAEQVEAAEAAVRKLKPELFEDTPPVRRAPAVNAPNSRTSSSSNRTKGVADLPPSAIKAGNDFVKRGMIPDLATYAKSWFAENPQ